MRHYYDPIPASRRVDLKTYIPIGFFPRSHATKIGCLKKKFLTVENIKAKVKYLTREGKKTKWSPRIRRHWHKFMRNKEKNIMKIYDMLNERTWIPGDFYKFEIKGKKDRYIYASDPVDQIVDLILNDCLEYVFLDKKKIVLPDVYGSIKDKGQHKVREKIINRIHNCNHTLKVMYCDTKQFYPSIDHCLLYQYAEAFIKDEWCLWLLWTTICRVEGDTGIAIGLCTSNILGHVYHAWIDWAVRLKYGKLVNYYRFCDDKFAVSKHSSILHELVHDLQDWSKLNKQVIKPNWRVLDPTHERFTCLGATINSHNSRLKKANRKKCEERFKLYDNPHKCDPNDITASWYGVKGSFKNLDLNNLIHRWKQRFSLCFKKIANARLFLKHKHSANRKAHRKNKDMQKLILKLKAKDPNATLIPRWWVAEHVQLWHKAVTLDSLREEIIVMDIVQPEKGYIHTDDITAPMVEELKEKIKEEKPELIEQRQREVLELQMAWWT